MNEGRSGSPAAMLFAFSDPSQRRLDLNPRSPCLSAGWVVREEAIMGTAIRVELWRCV